MTREETKSILKEIAILYPEGQQPTDPKRLVDLWTEALADESYDTIHGCLMKFFKSDTRGYAPKIGQILCMKSTQTDDRGLEDWGVWTE